MLSEDVKKTAEGCEELKSHVYIEVSDLPKKGGGNYSFYAFQIIKIV